METEDDGGSGSSSLVLLQTRLRRLEFLLSGRSDGDGASSTPTSTTTSSVHARLTALERELERLRKAGGPAGDLVRDIESVYARVGSSTATTPGRTTTSREDVATQASIVLAHATLYPETASRLSSLQTLPVPTAEQSARLAVLAGSGGGALGEAEAAALEREVQELRRRSARCLEWWVTVGVAAMGDVVDDWQARVGRLATDVGRLERRASEQRGYL